MITESAKRIEATRIIEETAAGWLARKDSGKWQAGDEASLDAWLQESMAHRVAYWRLLDTWENASRLQALGAGVQSREPPPPGRWNLTAFFGLSSQAVETAERRRSVVGRRALVASCLLALSTGAVWFASHEWRAGDRFETPVGAVASLPIEDGSTVTLNTDSRVSVRISDTERRVELTRGEAFFQVAKDPSRPFVVSAGNKRVIAVGTSFSVRRGIHAGSDDIQVVVTDGVVKVESVDAEPMGTAEQRLPAGSIANSHGQRFEIQHKPVREAQEQLSWKEGVLTLRNVTLAEAAAEFNRYNKRKLLIEDPKIAELPIAGSFRATSIDSFAEVIEKGYPIRIERRAGDFLIVAE